jgi:hypothetical protein
MKKICYSFAVVSFTALLWNPSAFADKKENTLLVWAGDQDHQAPDFVAVVDFDRHSPTYGKVLRTVPLSGASAVGNEPHHVGLSRDGKTLALGGLLGILRGNDEVFFFDVTDPRHPRFLQSDNPPNASITDEFASLKNGGFLGTFMGGADGAHPGRVVEYDEEGLQTYGLRDKNKGVVLTSGLRRQVAPAFLRRYSSLSQLSKLFDRYANLL